MTVRGGDGALSFPGQLPLFSVLSTALLLEETCCPGVPPAGLSWSQLQAPYKLVHPSLASFEETFTRPLCSSLEAYTGQLGPCKTGFGAYRLTGTKGSSWTL